MQQRRHDTGILGGSLPLHTPNSPGSAPIKTPAASAGRVSQFRRAPVLFPQPSREFACPIGDNDVCPCSLKRSHDLENGIALVQKAFLDGALDHRILAAHMINGSRFSKSLTNTPQNVHV